MKDGIIEFLFILVVMIGCLLIGYNIRTIEDRNRSMIIEQINDTQAVVIKKGAWEESRIYAIDIDSIGSKLTIRITKE